MMMKEWQREEVFIYFTFMAAEVKQPQDGHGCLDHLPLHFLVKNFRENEIFLQDHMKRMYHND
tara:strand:- start:1088 stop:1276 length:189 start_codon:yes stop_codon:yes gene_type:complete